jgi:putative ABC transport system permease protein
MKLLRSLLRSLILRPLARDPLRTALTVVAVALGVAVVVAIELAGDAATGSFRSSLESLAGKTDLEISANGGIDEIWMGRLAALPVDARFTPGMEIQAVIAGIGAVPVYGVDSIGAGLAGPAGSGRQGIAVSRALARRLNTVAGGTVAATIDGRVHRFRVARIADAGDAEFLALDIADYQQALGRYGKLDRIDVTVASEEDFARAERAIRGALPPGFLLERPGLRNQENQRMLDAFRWNLRVLSYISLAVGAFLIYNTISISVVRRRSEIGALRALGASRATVLWLFLAEALLFGAAGGALGLGIGRLLASLTVGMIADTVNSLWVTSRPSAIALSWRQAATAMEAGLLVALFSALAPAREAMAAAPTEAMSRGAHEHHARLRWGRGLAWSGLFVLLALAAAQAAPLDGRPVGGYAAGFLAIAAAALAAPALVLLVHRLTRSAMAQRVESLLAGRSLAASLSRTAVVVAALATAIAMMASVGIMVDSFRETVRLWLDNQLRADLYVRAAGPQQPGLYPPLPDSLIRVLATAPGVAAVDDYHGLPLHFRGERATLAGARMDIVRRYGRLRFLPGEDRDAILRSLANGADRCVVSEPFANKRGVRAGDDIDVALGGRTVRLLVAGIYYDYSSSQGYVIVDLSTLLKYLPGQPATNAAVYLAPGVDAGRVRRELQLRTAGYGVTVAANQELRRTSIAVFDRTFAITWALEAVAVVVAMLGAANSLLALVLDRRRELGLLRYLGASGGQVRGMVLTEAGLLGGFAAVLGLALGFVLSLLLIFVVNKQSFGWTIQFHPPRGMLTGALLLVWLVTVLAGLYPARVAARLDPLEAIREE